MAVLVLALVLVAIALGSTATAAERRPCRSALPRGPAVPAPLVFRTSYGGFRLAPDGTVTRLPERWLDVRSGGTGRRYGGDLELQRTRAGRLILLRQGRVAWRSRALYHNDAGSIAFGRGAFAFASARRDRVEAAPSCSNVVVVDTRSGAVRRLSELAARLPRRAAAERASAPWASDLQRS